MISDEKIAEIRERTDIVALIGEYVRLKRAGASFKGLCPFHSEKSPSFHVHPARQFYHCFGCKASGDSISFFMQVEGRTFPEALRILAERAGVEIPNTDVRDQKAYQRAKAKTERLVAVMDAAAGFFVKQLKEHPLGVMARDELERRGVKPDSAETFRLGYAPHGWDGLANWLKAQGHSVDDAVEVGLVVPRKSRDGVYDRFRHRLMFPVSDHTGRIVAFSGRILDPPEHEPLSDRAETGAKYINSPESPLYKKGEVLFGLHEGRVETRREGWALVCEGNFDLLALHQAGFKNSVAPLGTALTEAHVRRLKRLAGEVILLFDGDRAGRAAVRASFPLLSSVGLSAKVVTLPTGHDPDLFLREEGAEGLKTRIASAPAILDHLIDESASEAAGDPRAKAQAIEQLGPILAAVDNPVEVRLYIERLAQKFEVSDVDVVRQQLRRGVRAERRSRNTRAGSSRPAGETPVRAKQVVELPPLQCELLGVLLDNPSLFPSEEGEKLESLLTSSELKSIFASAKDVTGTRGRLDAPTLISSLSGNGALPWLEERLALQKYTPEQAEATLREGIPRLARRNIERELPQLEKRIHAARREGDEKLANTLMKEHMQLVRSAQQLIN